MDYLYYPLTFINLRLPDIQAAEKMLLIKIFSLLAFGILSMNLVTKSIDSVSQWVPKYCQQSWVEKFEWFEKNQSDIIWLQKNLGCADPCVSHRTISKCFETACKVRQIEIAKHLWYKYRDDDELYMYTQIYMRGFLDALENNHTDLVDWLYGLQDFGWSGRIQLFCTAKICQDRVTRWK